MEYGLVNVDSGLFISLERYKLIDGIVYLLTEIDTGQVPAGHNSAKYINLDGERVLSTRHEPRDVTIEGFVIASSRKEMSERKAVLNKLILPRAELGLTYGKYILSFRADRSVIYSTEWAENNQLLCKFLIQGTAHMPLWRLRSGRVFQESRLQGVPMFPLIIPSGRGKPYGVVPAFSVNNVFNEGDVAAGFTLRIKAARGAVTNPKVLNKKTQDFVEIIAGMSMGDELEICTVPGSQGVRLFTFADNVEIDMFGAVTFASRMSTSLNVGENDFALTAANGFENMDAVISFSPLWLEVQT